MDSPMNNRQEITPKPHKKWRFIGLWIFLVLIPGLLPCQAEDFPVVNEKFHTFALEWVTKIQSSYRYSQENPKIETDGDQFIASYYYLDETSVKTDVKGAKNSNQIYTGVLSYNEYLFQSRANTRSQALASKFEPVSMKQMMELFLYQDGSWVR